MNFTINKIKVHISFFFPAMIAFFVLRDKIGIIPSLLCGIFFHEICHILVMLLFGITIRKINITALGIDIKKNNSFLPLPKELLLHISAPTLNLIIALIFKNISNEIFAVNFILAIVNLIPIGNLDGGNALSALISEYINEEKRNLCKNFANIFFGIIFLTIGYFLYKNYAVSPVFLMLIIIMMFQNDI